MRADDLPDGVDFSVFDFAVNSGPSRAAKYLQAVAGARQDGKIGPQTLAAVKGRLAPTVINDLCDRRMAFLKGLKTWPTFRKGWTARVSDVRAKALQMAASRVSPEPTPSWKGGEPVIAQVKDGQIVFGEFTAPPPSPPTAPSLQNTQTSPGWLSLILSIFKPKGA